MPVLVLAILSIVLFVATLVMLGLAEAAETRRTRLLDSFADGGPFKVLSVCDAFEVEYAVLWETQAYALRLIASSRNGVPRHQLVIVYRRMAKTYPELYEGTCFQQWLRFLESAELVEDNGTRVRITPQGLEFLRFRVETKVAA